MRHSIARRLAGSTAALLLSAQTPAMAASPVVKLPILVDCGTRSEGAFCLALRQAVSEAWPEREVRLLEEAAEGWRLFFVEHEDSAEDLAGHLAWRDATGAAHRGPDLALTLMDQPKNSEAYHQFARDLIRISRLPF